MNFSLFFAVALLISSPTAKSSLIDLTKVESIPPETQEKLIRILSISFLKYIESAEFQKNSEDLPNELPEILIPIIPPFPEDSLPLDDWSGRIPDDSGIANWINGGWDFCDVSLNGLHSISNDLRLNISEAKLYFDIGTGIFNLDGRQEILIELLRNLNFGSNNDFFFGIHNLTIGVTIQLGNVNPFANIDIREVTIDIESDGLDISFENSTVNGVPFDTWDDVSKALTNLLTLVWTNLLKPNVQSLVQVALHDLLKDCKPIILFLGDYSCLGLEPGDKLEKLIMAELNDIMEFPTIGVCALNQEPTTRPSMSEGTTTPQMVPTTVEDEVTTPDAASQLGSTIILIIPTLLFLFHL